MLALGLIIIVLAGLLIAAIATGAGTSFEVDLFGVDVSTSTTGLFFSGVAVGAGVLVGLTLIRRGMRRGWRRRRGHPAEQQPAQQPEQQSGTGRPAGATTGDVPYPDAPDSPDVPSSTPTPDDGSTPPMQGAVES